MSYETPLYRPPSEADSLILQLTIGCSHNNCTFCSMYKKKKYRIKPFDEIVKHIEWGKGVYPHAKRLFLADGNVLSMKTHDLVRVLDILKREFDHLERVSAYAGPKDLLDKSEEELVQIHNAGLSLLYMGVESGSEQILKDINKGVSSEQMILAGKKALNAKYSLSCTVISGLGGKELKTEHAKETARIINAIQPHFLGLLTLMVERGTVLESLIKEGKFSVLNPMEVIEEMYVMIEALNLEDCIFRSNHASNYLYLKGNLKRDKERILQILEEARNNPDFFALEDYRSL